MMVGIDEIYCVVWDFITMYSRKTNHPRSSPPRRYLAVKLAREEAARGRPLRQAGEEGINARHAGVHLPGARARVIRRLAHDRVVVAAKRESERKQVSRAREGEAFLF